MAETIYNNVEGFLVIDNGRTVEDVTSFTLPGFVHPTTTISASGMAMDIDVPNTARYNASDYTVAHNNGRNCKYLQEPGKHVTELRMVRQKYGTANQALGHESVKFRMTGFHAENSKGSVEMNNPYGSSDKYSLVRYEEYIDNVAVTIIDAAAGIIASTARIMRRISKTC